MAAHRYWRITNLTVGSAYLLLSELALYDANFIRKKVPASGLTAQTAPGGPGDFTTVMQDDVYTGEKSWSKGTAEGASFWIKWDYGSGNSEDIIYFQQACGSLANQHIHQCDVEYSDDDSAWTPVGTINLPSLLASATPGIYHDIAADLPTWPMIVPVGFFIAMGKEVAKTLQITTSISPALLKGYFTTMQINTSIGLSMLKALAMAPLQVTMTSTNDMVKEVGKNLQVTMTGATTMVKEVGKTLQATMTAAPQLLKGYFIGLSVTMGSTVTQGMVQGKLLVAQALITAQLLLTRVGFRKAVDDATAYFRVRKATAVMPKRETTASFKLDE